MCSKSKNALQLLFLNLLWLGFNTAPFLECNNSPSLDSQISCKELKSPGQKWFQRFNFLNGLDCPDWLLAEITEISKMVKNHFLSIKFAFIQPRNKFRRQSNTNCCVELCWIGCQLRLSTRSTRRNMSMNHWVQLTIYEVWLRTNIIDGDSIARIMTATSYIIENATLSITPTSDLIRELEQLGMTSGICCSSEIFLFSFRIILSKKFVINHLEHIII